MDDPFSTSSRLEPSPQFSKHKPTLTTLISSVDLQQLSSRRTGLNAEGADGDDDGRHEQVDLPTNAPLSHESFQTSSPDEEWDTSEFLLGRRHTALDELRSELRTHLATLRSSLVEVINTEYEAFIGLSLGLRHAFVASSVTSIRRPVLSIRNEVAQVKEDLQNMQQEMGGVLEKRKKVREDKALLRRLLEMDEWVDKVEMRLRLPVFGQGGERGAEEGVDSERTGWEEGAALVDSPAKRLERIVGEYNHMLYLINKAGDLPFVRSLEPRVTRITTTLKSDLSHLLTSVLVAASPSATNAPSPSITREELTSLLKIYASLDAIAEAEETIRKIVVRPWVTRIIHRNVLTSVQSPVLPSVSTSLENVTGSRGGSNQSAPAVQLIPSDDQRAILAAYFYEPIRFPSGGTSSETTDVASADSLLTLYNRILATISTECGLILDVAERTIAAPTPMPLAGGGLMIKTSSTDDGLNDRSTGRRFQYDILSNVIWEEVGNRLISELGNVIFAAGRPSVFHQNYVLTSTFISRIEGYCSSIPHLSALRTSPTYVDFFRRFQLPVYFQLRFKEIVTSVERALDVGSASGGGDMFVMSESEAVWRALSMCWAEEVWLEELNGKFWKLTLQLVSRYRTWLNTVVPRYVMPSNAMNLSVTGSAAPNAGSSQFEGTERARVGTPSDEATEEATLRQLTVLIADSTLMERKVLELYHQSIAPRLPQDLTQPATTNPSLSEEDPSNSPLSVLRDSLSQTTSIVPPLSSQIITILVKRCSEHLKLVRSTVSQVRASTKRGPLEPSYFVSNILKDLRNYVAGPAKVVDEELRKRWATMVVEEIAQRYATVLSAQKKTDESLRWYKKGRSAGLSLFGRGSTTTSSTTDDPSPDDDRVKQQMQMDIEALAQDARTLGVDTSSSEAFGLLRNALTDEEKK
ncbi:BQ5605_C007g04684 [Microbotryum silenes-dioicae]|uniref:Conserved oligomeric Golgi complex subunit 2 n=1 Tax=Microbotryum silenes-dioicae TaxID=796604 RepID=A0A2X0MBU5_9BASI|nr:BQ5605_C007g04684 [Microbotryum silenes-dioicae]